MSNTLIGASICLPITPFVCRFKVFFECMLMGCECCCFFFHPWYTLLIHYGFVQQNKMSSSKPIPCNCFKNNWQHVNSITTHKLEINPPTRPLLLAPLIIINSSCLSNSYLWFVFWHYSSNICKCFCLLYFTPNFNRFPGCSIHTFFLVSSVIWCSNKKCQFFAK